MSLSAEISLAPGLGDGEGWHVDRAGVGRAIMLGWQGQDTRFSGQKTTWHFIYVYLPCT